MAPPRPLYLPPAHGPEFGEILPACSLRLRRFRPANLRAVRVASLARRGRMILLGTAARLAAPFPRVPRRAMARGRRSAQFPRASLPPGRSGAAALRPWPRRASRSLIQMATLWRLLLPSQRRAKWRGMLATRGQALAASSRLVLHSREASQCFA